jgi:hypothetical protein
VKPSPIRVRLLGHLKATPSMRWTAGELHSMLRPRPRLQTVHMALLRLTREDKLCRDGYGHGKQAYFWHKAAS